MTHHTAYDRDKAGHPDDIEELEAAAAILDNGQDVTSFSTPPKQQGRFNRWGIKSYDVWALSPHSTRVHIAPIHAARTNCDLPVSETRDRVEPDYLFCTACQATRTRVMPIERKEVAIEMP